MLRWKRHHYRIPCHSDHFLRNYWHRALSRVEELASTGRKTQEVRTEPPQPDPPNQASTMVQIMGVVSRTSLPFPSWFQLSFTLLIVLVTWPFSFQPACLEFVYAPTSFQGFSLFTLTQALIYFLVGLHGYKWLSNRPSKDFCRSMQIVAGLLYICSALILLASTLKAVELKDRNFNLESGTAEEIYANFIELFIEASLQGYYS